MFYIGNGPCIKFSFIEKYRNTLNLDSYIGLLTVAVNYLQK